MNIRSTRVNHNRIKPQIQANPKQDSTFSNVQDGFAKAAQTVIDHPTRSLTNVASLGAMASGLATMGSTSLNGNSIADTGMLMGAVHGISACGRGLSASVSSPLGETYLGKDPKKHMFSALGDALSATGHFALQAGVTAALVIGGALVSSAFDYNS